jgi:putative transposase
MQVPSEITCPYCNAPHRYIYYNNGKKKTQLKCKVCEQPFQLNKPLRPSKTTYYCPHCGHALYQWKKHLLVSSYKCCNDNCPYRINKINKLNASEKMLQKMQPTHFKVNYQYREYHLTSKQIQHSEPPGPNDSRIDIFKIRKSDNVLGLVLAFYISFANSARKTALILQWVFGLPICYQTVLNYVNATAYYAHQFNLKHKGNIDSILVGDETYIKIIAKHHYVWFYISAKRRSIVAYHMSDNRGTIPAIAATNEATQTTEQDQQTTIITDGNPAYIEAIQFLNKNRPKEHKIKHIQVIGLQNNDEVSEEYRPFKQLIERFNRTYKQHVKPAAGFNSFSGAMALTTLFVTYYNFLRPHSSLGQQPPIHIAQLEDVSTIQAKWLKLISMML